MRTFFIAIILVFAAAQIFAQHEADNWYFGYHCWLRFENGQPIPAEGGQTGSTSENFSKWNGIEGTSVYSDPQSGKMLLYSDGTLVWNSNHQTNGKQLLGTYSTSQSALIIPQPGSKSIFYIFNPGDWTTLENDKAKFQGFAYTLVNLSGGTSTQENVILQKKDISEAVSATVDCTGEGYWVVAHSAVGNIFYAYHIDNNGLSTNPVVSSISSGGYFCIGSGNMKFSPNGKKIALTNPSRGALEVYNFDQVTGKISQYLDILPPQNINYEYGVSFSPDNSKLYCGQRGTESSGSEAARLVQFDLSLPKEKISSSRYPLPVYDFNQPGGMQLAPNGKIYIIRPGQCLGVIEKPDSSGFFCSYKEKSVCFPSGAIPSRNLPTFVESIFNEGRKELRCAPPIAIMLTKYFCTNNLYEFRDTSDNFPTSWQWSFPGGNPSSFSGQFPPPVQFSQPGKHLITLITQNSYGADTTSQEIEVFMAPEAKAGPDVILCGTSSATLGTPAQDGMIYSWSPATDLSDPNSAMPVATPKVSREYYLAVTNQAGCIDYDTVFVSIGEITAKGASICLGDSAEISVLQFDGAAYEWTPVDGLSDPSSPTPIASPKKTQVYRVIVSGKCTDTAFVTVTVTDPPVVASAPDKNICRGESIQIGLPGDKNFSYLWTPRGNLSDPDIANPFANPDVTTRYILEIKNPSGCAAYDTVVVHIDENFAIDAGPGRTLCFGEGALLHAEGAADSYQWSDSTGKILSMAREFSFKPEKNGKLYLSAKKGNCTGLDSVEIFLRPEIQLFAQNVTICEGQSAQLSVNSSSNIISWKWSPEEFLTDANIPNPIANPPSTKEYLLTATDEIGCTATKIVRVIISPKKNISIVLSADEFSFPGQETHMNLKIQADDVVTAIKGKFSFDANMATLNEDSKITAPAGWIITANEIKPGEVDFEGAGPEILSGELQFPMLVFLSEIKKADTYLEISEPKENSCRIISVQEKNIFETDKVCADQIRTVKIGKENFSLSPALPNPATDKIKIAYATGYDCPVKIILYNSMGEEISVIENAKRSSGKHEVEFPLERFSSGLYYYRMIAGEFSSTQPLIIRK